MNITLLSLAGRFHMPCLAVRVIVIETLGDNQRLYHWPFCPGNPPQSFYSTGNVADIRVQTSPTCHRLFMENNFFNEWINNLTFQYQIQVNDISLNIDNFLHENVAEAMLCYM